MDFIISLPRGTPRSAYHIPPPTGRDSLENLWSLSVWVCFWGHGMVLLLCCS